MKKIIIFGISAAALLLGACSKVTEMDAPETVKVTYPDGLSFRASLSSVTKASFSGDNSGQLVWDGNEDVAILAVPVLDTRGMSFDEFHEYDINHVVSGFASVEVDPADPSMAILHTAKTAEDWAGDASRVQFFAVYPANGVIPEIDYTEERDGRLLLKVLKDIPTEQDGINYQNALSMAGCTAAYYVENGTFVSAATGGTEVQPQFLGFSPGNAVLSFKILNTTSDALPIKSVKISSVQLDEYNPSSYPDWSPEDMSLSGTTSFLLFDDTDKYGENPELGMLVYPFDPDGDGARLNNYVMLNFPETVSVPAGSTTSQYYYAAVCGNGEFKRYEMPGFLRFEALDAEGNILAVCERAYPSYWDDDDKWEYNLGLDSGYRYNLTVAFGEDSDYHFIVSSQPDAAGSWGENTIEGFVRSYKMDNGTPSYLEWDYDGVFYDPACTQTMPQEEWETWLKSWTKDSPAEGESATAKYKAYVTVKANPNPKNLEVAPYVASWDGAKGTADAYYNLSNQTNGGSAIENTANCYLIHGPGFYTFPCVLGNGIKNGTANAGAWIASDNSSDADSILSAMLDYTGSAVESPYLHNSSSSVAAPAQAVVLWQDAQNLIGNVSLVKDDDTGVWWVKFQTGTIQQGNAVIAVKDANGVIMWSWHIWATDVKLDGSDDISVDGVKFSKANLGWVQTMVVKGWQQADNLAYIRIRQEESGKTAVVRLLQKGQSQEYSDGLPSDGYNPLYQWGRKDPMIPGIPSGSATAAGEDVVSGLSVELYEYSDPNLSRATINYAIQHPMTLIFADGNDKEDYAFYNRYKKYYNLWNALGLGGHVNKAEQYASLNDTQRKTIYDPCPVGYQVPQLKDVTRFKYETIVASDDEPARYSTTYSEGNSVVESYSDKGIYLYANYSTTLFFPFSGTRTAYHYGGVTPGSLWSIEGDNKESWAYSYMSYGLTNRMSEGTPVSLLFFLYGITDEEGLDLAADAYAYVSNEQVHDSGYSKWAYYPWNYDAGFIRPVEDRSVAYEPPLSFDGNGAGSYNDVNL
ncbi:MAG: hypothetical protein IKX37_00910 [Bacteroidales bacterium]|nr:hypothetical protein [Bacteroidales bacterium]